MPSQITTAIIRSRPHEKCLPLDTTSDTTAEARKVSAMAYCTLDFYSGECRDQPAETLVISPLIEFHAESRGRPPGLISPPAITYAAAQLMHALPANRELNPSSFGRHDRDPFNLNAGSSLGKIDSSAIKPLTFPGNQTRCGKVYPFILTSFIGGHYSSPESSVTQTLYLAMAGNPFLSHSLALEGVTFVALSVPAGSVPSVLFRLRVDPCRTQRVVLDGCPQCSQTALPGAGCTSA